MDKKVEQSTPWYYAVILRECWDDSISPRKLKWKFVGFHRFHTLEELTKSRSMQHYSEHELRAFRRDRPRWTTEIWFDYLLRIDTCATLAANLYLEKKVELGLPASEEHGTPEELLNSLEWECPAGCNHSPWD